MRIPLIGDLVKEPIHEGSHLIVEYDPSTQWYAASLSMAAEWLHQGGTISYNLFTQPPDIFRSQLKRLGVNTEELESQDKLQIFDWYTATLGEKSKEKYGPPSLKIADVSIFWAKQVMSGPPLSDTLRIVDSVSFLARFNDEKSWVEFLLTRAFPTDTRRKLTTLRGMTTGVHSEWAYRQLEAAADGIVDFKLSEAGEQPTTLVRIRSMRSVGFDGRWRQLKVEDNMRATLET